MASQPCQININGNTFYYPCDYTDYIVVVDNSLINTGQQTINFYSDFIVYGDNTSGYPRIIAPVNTKAYIRQSYNSNTYQLNVQSYEFINRNISNNILLLVVILGVLICQLFKR